VAVLTALRLALADRASLAELIDENEATNAVLGVTFALLGALAVADRPRNALSWLFVAEGQFNSLAVLGARWVSYAERTGQGTKIVDLAAWLGAFSWIPGFLLATVVLPFIYPTGTWQSRGWRRLGWAAVAFATVATVLAVTSSVPMADFPGHRNPLAIFPWSDSSVLLGPIIVLALAFAALGLVGLLLRFRAGDSTTRAQVGWLFLALLFNVAVALLPVELPGLIGAAFLAAALGLAVVRYHLYDVERLFNRAAVYGVLTTAIVGAFALFAWLVGERLQQSVVGAVLAAVVVALGAGPAREWLQRAVDRLLYGQRLNPYDALAGMGRQLETTSTSHPTGLATVAAAVSDALRLPYVAITVAGSSEPAVVSGKLRGGSVDVPLVHAGQHVGVLTVGLRPGERHPTSRDEALLADFARLIAAAAAEMSLSADLRRSRERLVAAREEERRRLRRELHDGLGPALAGLALSVGAARRAVLRRDDSSEQLLAGLETDVATLLTDVRRISHDLRPAALDELGLIGALKQAGDAVTHASGGLPLVEVMGDGVAELPAAVEVAAYRIATEGVTNVVRHAKATRCTVRLTRAAGLFVEVSDNGQGLPAQLTPGVGLASMAERAAEIGGTFTVESVPGTGTTLRAELPLGAPA
jgi:two-component system, NarL family, sensor kinase